MPQSPQMGGGRLGTPAVLTWVSLRAWAFQVEEAVVNERRGSSMVPHVCVYIYIFFSFEKQRNKILIKNWAQSQSGGPSRLRSLLGRRGQ